MLPPRSQVRRTNGQAPIIPEIAQAYQNDPRTRLAQQAIANGVDTAPVAEGQYAWADAAARALSAGLGGFQDKRLREQYGKQDDATVEERAVAAQAALEAEQAKMGVPGMKPGTPLPSQAAAIAGALGAPAPKTAAVAASAPMGGGTPPPGPAGLPMAPPPVSPALPGAPPAAPSRGVALTDPLAGTGRVSSGYGAARPNGRRHNGLDYAAPAGTPVGAAAGGRVIRAWNDTANGGGNSVLIRHPDGTTTGYAHLAAFNVRPGDTVEPGQPIGSVGSTGRSSGPHLHFTYRDANGRRVDPSTLQFGQQAEDAGQPADPTTVLPEVEVENYGPSNAYGVAAEPMPSAPDPVGATRSRGLNAAYQLAAGGNPYESARAQQLITAGLDNQTDLDERAAARQNDLNMTTYRSALDRYGRDRSDIRQMRYGRSERVEGQDFQRDERVGSQQFQSGENDKNRTFQRSERIGQQEFQAGQSAAERAAARSNLELQVGSREEVARTRAMNTPAFIRAQTEATTAVQAGAEMRRDLDEFLSLNREQRTGGARERYGIMGIDTFGNRRLQAMEAIANRLTTSMSTQLKGALSDKDIQFLRDGNVGIGRTRGANASIAATLNRAIERGNEFQVERLEALARQDTGFARAWAAYTEAMPLFDPRTGAANENAKSFAEWKASLERVGY